MEPNGFSGSTSALSRTSEEIKSLNKWSGATFSAGAVILSTSALESINVRPTGRKNEH
jgi:hypothetical protein